MVGLVEAGYYTVDGRPLGRRLHRLPGRRRRGRPARPGRGHALALPQARTAAGPAATCAGLCSGSSGWPSSPSSSRPFGISYMTTHVHTAEVPEAELGAAYEDVTFTTSDGLEIAGWYVPSRNGAAVIIPGRTKSQPHARMLIEHGYGVLLFDRRGEGASEGDPNLYGWGGSPRHPRRRRLPPGPAGRRPRPDRWSRPLRLRRDAAPGRRRELGPGRRGLRGCRHPLHERGARGVRRATTIRGFHAVGTKQAGLMMFSNQPPPPSLVDLMPRIAPTPGAAHLGARTAATARR